MSYFSFKPSYRKTSAPHYSACKVMCVSPFLGERESKKLFFCVKRKKTFFHDFSVVVPVDTKRSSKRSLRVAGGFDYKFFKDFPLPLPTMFYFDPHPIIFLLKSHVRLFIECNCHLLAFTSEQNGRHC